MSIAVRYFSHIERDMQAFMDIMRASRFPMDTFYFDEEENAYILRSHPFLHREDAVEYASYLEQVFRRGKAMVYSENEERHFLHYNPDEIYDEDLEDFIRCHHVDLFTSSEGFYSNKIKSDALKILSELNTTNVPMDACTWNRSNNAYYLVSNTFSKEFHLEANNYRDLFLAVFGGRSACTYEDYVGRRFVCLDPSTICGDIFKDFIKYHRQEKFVDNAKRSLGTANIVSCFYKNTAGDIDHILKMLRKTNHPMDNYVYDQVRSAYYLRSVVFPRSDSALDYAQCFKDAFGDAAAAVHSDLEGRSFVFVDPTHLQINAFKHFINTHQSKLFPD